MPGAAISRACLRAVVGVFRAFALDPFQLGVQTAFADQRVVGTNLDDAPGLQHHDAVRMAGRGHAMRDEQCGLSSAQLLEFGENVLLSSCVDAREAVVQNQHRRLADEAAGEGRALLLTARQRDAAFSHQRLQAVWEFLDGVFEIRRGGGLPDGCQWPPGIVVGEIVSQRLPKQKRVLGHHRDLRAQLRQGVVTDIVPVHEHRARGRVQQAKQQLEQRGFACTYAAHD